MRGIPLYLILASRGESPPDSGIPILIKEHCLKIRNLVFHVVFALNILELIWLLHGMHLILGNPCQSKYPPSRVRFQSHT